MSFLMKQVQKCIDPTEENLLEGFHKLEPDVVAGLLHLIDSLGVRDKENWYIRAHSPESVSLMWGRATPIHYFGLEIEVDAGGLASRSITADLEKEQGKQISIEDGPCYDGDEWKSRIAEIKAFVEEFTGRATA